MEKTIPVAQANRQFSRLLRSVGKGCSYAITRYGQPVARIVPIDRREDATAIARRVLLERLEKKPIVALGDWSRDDLYADER